MTQGSEVDRTDLGTVDLLRVLETAVNPFVLIDLTGTVLWAGASIEEVLGVSAADLVGRSMVDFLTPESTGAAVRAMAEADAYVRSRQEGPDEWEGPGPLLDLVRPDGTEITCSVAVATPARTGLPGYAIQLRRATSAGALEHTFSAMASGAALPAVLDQLARVVAGDLPNTDVVIGHVPAGRDLTDGLPFLAGSGPTKLLDRLREPAGAATPWALAAARPGEIVQIAAAELSGPLREAAEEDGASYVVALATRTSPDEAPTGVLVAWRRHAQPLHVFAVEMLERGARLIGLALQWDIGRRALEWSANHDGLTGLRNRQAFLATLQEHAQAPPETAAVLYLDLDDFKPVNDRHGHALGDRVLTEVAARLRRAVRPTDIVARLGGDEFGVLCPGLADRDQVELLASRLVEEVSRPLEVSGIDVTVGISAGIAELVDAERPEEVLGRADAALRRAKREGKHRWRHA